MAVEYYAVKLARKRRKRLRTLSNNLKDFDAEKFIFLVGILAGFILIMIGFLIVVINFLNSFPAFIQIEPTNKIITCKIIHIGYDLENDKQILLLTDGKNLYKVGTGLDKYYTINQTLRLRLVIVKSKCGHTLGTRYEIIGEG